MARKKANKFNYKILINLLTFNKKRIKPIIKKFNKNLFNIKVNPKKLTLEQSKLLSMHIAVLSITLIIINRDFKYAHVLTAIAIYTLNIFISLPKQDQYNLSLKLWIYKLSEENRAYLIDSYNSWLEGKTKNWITLLQAKIFVLRFILQDVLFPKISYKLQRLVRPTHKPRL